MKLITVAVLSLQLLFNVQSSGALPPQVIHISDGVAMIRHHIFSVDGISPGDDHLIDVNITNDMDFDVDVYLVSIERKNDSNLSQQVTLELVGHPIVFDGAHTLEAYQTFLFGLKTDQSGVFVVSISLDANVSNAVQQESAVYELVFSIIQQQPETIPETGISVSQLWKWLILAGTLWVILDISASRKEKL